MLPSGPGPQNQQFYVSGGGGRDGEICPNSLSLPPTALPVPLLQNALRSGSESLGWEGNCGQLSGMGRKREERATAEAAGSGGQSLGQWPGGLLRCQGTPKSGTAFYSVTLCLGMLRITASVSAAPESAAFPLRKWRGIGDSHVCGEAGKPREGGYRSCIQSFNISRFF